MFELFNVDELYFCTIEDIVPMGMQNFGGCISIESSNQTRYETIVCLKNGKYYDINHLDRIINIDKFSQKEFPITSKNSHLYIIDTDSLVSYRDKVNTSCKILQRLPFGRSRLLN